MNADTSPAFFQCTPAMRNFAFGFLVLVATTASANAAAMLGPPDKPISLPDEPSAPSTPALPSPVADPLGGLDVLIADRGNNRVLLVSSQKQILWEYDFGGLKPKSGADDAFFADEGHSIVVNLEHEQVVEVIDIASKTITWQYRTLGKRGSRLGLVNYPDDAYKLPNGDIILADIRNCRVLEVAPDKHITRQAGVTDKCRGGPTTLASPKGDKPLPNGHILVSTIGDHSLTELDATLAPVFKLSLPLRYPSDPQMTMAGNFLVADYVRRGRIIEPASHSSSAGRAKFWFTHSRCSRDAKIDILATIPSVR